MSGSAGFHPMVAAYRLAGLIAEHHGAPVESLDGPEHEMVATARALAEAIATAANVLVDTAETLDAWAHRAAHDDTPTEETVMRLASALAWAAHAGTEAVVATEGRGPHCDDCMWGAVKDVFEHAVEHQLTVHPVDGRPLSSEETAVIRDLEERTRPCCVRCGAVRDDLRAAGVTEAGVNLYVCAGGCYDDEDGDDE